jgi:hypothetical protein
LGLIIPLNVEPVVLQPPHMRPFLDDKVGIEAVFGRASRPRRRDSARHEARSTRIFFTKIEIIFLFSIFKIFDFLCDKLRKKHFQRMKKKEKNNLSISIEPDLELKYSSMMDYFAD